MPPQVFKFDQFTSIQNELDTAGLIVFPALALLGAALLIRCARRNMRHTLRRDPDLKFALTLFALGPLCVCFTQFSEGARSMTLTSDQAAFSFRFRRDLVVPLDSVSDVTFRDERGRRKTPKLVFRRHDGDELQVWSLASTTEAREELERAGNVIQARLASSVERLQPQRSADK